MITVGASEQTASIAVFLRCGPLGAPATITVESIWLWDRQVHPRVEAIISGDPVAIDDSSVVNENEQRFHALFDQVTVGIAQADLTGRFVLANQRFCDMIGYSPTEVLALRMQDITHPLDLPASEELFNNVIAGTARSAAIEKRCVRKDGSIIWMNNTVSLIRDAQGQPRHVCAVSLDITASRQAEQELQRAKEAAEAANRAKDQFLAVLSHELRTPLMPVLAIVSALEQQTDLPRDVRADLEVVRRNVELETRLIDDLLDLTRITKGKLQLTLEPVDVRESINRVVEICRDDIESKGLLLLIDLPGRACHAHADSARLQQVLWNLVKNAIKFTPPGGKITLRAACDDGAIHINVTDTGVGIDPQAMPRVFDAFEQGHAQMPHRFGGLGLGLSISKALAHAHGGTLEAFSEGRDRGSTFTLTLPAARLMTTAPPEAAVAPPSAAPVLVRRILLVEDHQDTARIMLRLLQSSHFEVEWAGDIATAQQLAAASKFDLLISDLGLPDGSGLDLMHDLRDRFAGKAIALSGYGMEDDLRRSRAAGFAEHLTKPINMQALRSAIDRVLGE
jgi:two-component system CheB/CheR fusion protein